MLIGCKRYLNVTEETKRLKNGRISKQTTRTRIDRWKTFTDEELKAMANHRFYDYGEKLSLLLWRFSFAMDGINMLDMIKLKTSNIETVLDAEGNLVRILRWTRSKTSVEISTSMATDAELIIEFFQRYKHFFPAC